MLWLVSLKPIGIVEKAYIFPFFVVVVLLNFFVCFSSPLALTIFLLSLPQASLSSEGRGLMHVPSLEVCVQGHSLCPVSSCRTVHLLLYGRRKLL